ncbi:RNA polymerase sigma factor [Aeromicrobium duanguangcaii]|uniref:RNA polymerase sigma factor n=1 Tax=Aeromicrobium duanguangcaii TaxID=2968086 RepID=UPI002017D576|nr:RNA polymerase sigma factor [Aeromicrobium duanguangcaii]MCL3838194.1 RNA polymerase sigma factor [Aeromicrobium duanguangcaii]
MKPIEGVAAIGRDSDALEAFYREHIEAVQRFIARRVEAPEDAADLTAEVFLAAIRASRDYRGDAAAPRAWLYGIARRVVAGHHRSTIRALRAVRQIDARELLDDDAADRIVARIDSQRAVRAVYRSLATLPERQRAVVELVAVDGLPLTEAAAALGISAGNARVLYHRARRRLARALSQPLPDPVEVTS